MGHKQPHQKMEKIMKTIEVEVLRGYGHGLGVIKEKANRKCPPYMMAGKCLRSYPKADLIVYVFELREKL